MIIGFDNYSWSDNVNETHPAKVYGFLLDLYNTTVGKTKGISLASGDMVLVETNENVYFKLILNNYLKLKPAFRHAMWQMLVGTFCRMEEVDRLNFNSLLRNLRAQRRVDDVTKKIFERFKIFSQDLGFSITEQADISVTGKHFKKASIILGLARFLDLYASRGSRVWTNDVLLSWIWTRENGVNYTDTGSDAGGWKWHNIVDDKPKEDKDDEQGFDLAVGFGEKHYPNFLASMQFLGLTPGKLVTEHQMICIWLASSTWPWWLQSLLVDGEVQYVAKAWHIPDLHSRSTLKKWNSNSIAARKAWYWQFWSGQTKFLSSRKDYFPTTIGWTDWNKTLRDVAMHAYNKGMSSLYDWDGFKDPYDYISFGEPATASAETNFYPILPVDEYEKWLNASTSQLEVIQQKWQLGDGNSATLRSAIEIFVDALTAEANAQMTNLGLTAMTMRGASTLQVTPATPMSFRIKI